MPITPKNSNACPIIAYTATIVAVTKYFGFEQIIRYYELGLRNFGENRVKDALEKIGKLPDEIRQNSKFHLIGHLQTNKVRQAVKHFDLIHSIDSPHLAQAVNRAAESIDKIQAVLIQINLAREVQKSGVAPEELDSLIETVQKCGNLKLRGFMMIAPNYEDAEQCRPLFKQMYQLFRRQREVFPTIEILSMGMTHDYRIAIEEGANLVRIGTAIFGERDYH